MNEFEERYTLICETVNKTTGEIERRVTNEFPAESLTEVLENVTYFLNGVSYTYVGGLEKISKQH